MEDTKPWYASKAVIGGVLAAVAGIAAMIGYQFSAPAVEQTTNDTLLIVESIVAIIGGALAIWGRIKATKKIAP